MRIEFGGVRLDRKIAALQCYKISLPLDAIEIAEISLALSIKQARLNLLTTKKRRYTLWV